MHKGLFSLSLESAGVDPTLDPVEPVVSDGEVDTILDSSDMGGDETDIVNQEIDVAQNAVDQGEIIEDATADVVEKLHQAADEGGLSPAGAGAMSAALEALRRVVHGADAPKREFAVEAFKDRESRVDATRALALEAEGFLADVGKGIMNVISLILQKLGDFVRAAVNDAERYRQKSLQLAKVASSLVGKAGEIDQPLEDGHLARVLSIDGHAPDPGQFAQAYAKFSGGHTSLDLRKQLAVAQRLTMGTAKLMGAESSNEQAGADRAFEEIAGVLEEAVGDVNGEQKFVFGGVGITMALNDNHITAQLTSSADQVNGQLRTLSPEVCRDVAEAAATHFKGWIDSAKGLKSLEDLLKTLGQRAGLVKNILGGVGAKEASGRFNFIRTLVKDIQAYVMVAIKGVREYELTTSKAAVQYVAKSLAVARQSAGNAKPAPAAA